MDLGKYILRELDKKLTKSVEQVYRDKLAGRIHILDISYESLQINYQDEDTKLTKSEYKKFIELIKSTPSIFTSTNLLQVLEGVSNTGSRTDYTAIVQNDPAHPGTFIVAKNYSVLQNTMSKVLASMNRESIFSRSQINTIATNKTLNPASMKIKDILINIPLSSQRPIVEELNKLYRNYTINSSFNFKQDGFGGSGNFVITTLHSFKHSNELAKLESNILKQVDSIVSSNSFRDSIVKDLIPIEDIGTEIVKILNPKAKVNINKKKTSNASSKINTKSKETIGSSRAKLRGTKGQFFSLTSLQTLLNANLAKQIQQNMGKGNAKSILNYRTGRFAESARVTSISNKDNAITAFYTYMKNPYQTFEPGYAQGSPTTRDPRKLIERSIREIAKDIVTNRLRTLPV